MVSKVLRDSNYTFSWIYHFPLVSNQSVSQGESSIWARISFWEFGQSKTHQCPKEPIRKLLITTMGRSGSSFTGNILSSMMKESYYAFEPLWDSGILIKDGSVKLVKI